MYFTGKSRILRTYGFKTLADTTEKRFFFDRVGELCYDMNVSPPQGGGGRRKQK